MEELSTEFMASVMVQGLQVQWGMRNMYELLKKTTRCMFISYQQINIYFLMGPPTLILNGPLWYYQ